MRTSISQINNNLFVFSGHKESMMQLTIQDFLGVLLSLVVLSSSVEYSNRWTVQINGDYEESERLALKHGFLNTGKVQGSTTP